MAKIVSFEVEGMNAVIGNIEKISKGLYEKFQEMMAGFMFSVLANAQQRCPVDTGALRASLHIDQESEWTWYFADGVSYGKHQEFGFHHKGTGQFIQNPFAMPAFYSALADFPPVLLLK